MSPQTPPTSFEDAFHELFPRAYQVAYRLLGQAEAAEDVAAEALARTYRHWPRLKDLPYREAWVAKVAANLSIDGLRRRPPAEWLPRPTSPSSSPEDTVDLRLALAAALSALPKRQRQAVALRYLVDLPAADVAQVLRISSGSVKRHVHRGLSTLRSRLGPGLSEVLNVVHP